MNNNNKNSYELAVQLIKNNKAYVCHQVVIVVVIIIDIIIKRYNNNHKNNNI